MDFFKDFSEISSTPIYSKHTQESNQKNKNAQKYGNAKKDEFDDLLSDLMSKQDMKKSRKNIEPYSSQVLANPDPFTKTTQKFYQGTTETELNMNFGLSKQGQNKGSKKSILDDLMSEDNRSIKSGATGRRESNQPTESLSFGKTYEPALVNQVSQPSIGGRAAMRPPLKKKAESRQPSLFNDDNRSVSRMNDNLGSIEDLDVISNTPKMPRRQTNLPDRIQESEFGLKLDLSASKQKPSQPFKPFEPQKPSSSSLSPRPAVQEKIIQKVIHVPADTKELTSRHQEELKLIKESYERQIISLKDNYEKIIKDEQHNRKVLVKTYEESVELERRKWEKVVREEGERVKQVHEWEMKKKTENYEIEVKKLKELLQTITRSQSHNSSTAQSQSVSHQATLQLTTKLSQLETERERLQTQSLLIETRRRQLESEQHEFDLYKRREQNKLNDERKKLFEYETEVRKRQVEMKKAILSQKQALAAELVNGEMTLAQGRENLRHEAEKLSMEKELFNQQKMEYEKINNKILGDLKQRQKILETQKQQAHELQVELYKKINTIELMSMEKGLSTSPKPIPSLNQTKARASTGNRSVSYYEDHTSSKENNRNRINSELDNKIAETKGRYQQMEQIARSNSIQRETQREQGGKIHLERYIEKLGRDRLKLGKC